MNELNDYYNSQAFKDASGLNWLNSGSWKMITTIVWP